MSFREITPETIDYQQRMNAAVNQIYDSIAYRGRTADRSPLENIYFLGDGKTLNFMQYESW